MEKTLFLFFVEFEIAEHIWCGCELSLEKENMVKHIDWSRQLAVIYACDHHIVVDLCGAVLLFCMFDHLISSCSSFCMFKMLTKTEEITTNNVKHLSIRRAVVQYQ